MAITQSSNFESYSHLDYPSAALQGVRYDEIMVNTIIEMLGTSERALKVADIIRIPVYWDNSCGNLIET